MMNYQEMSDFEINKTVLKTLLKSGYIKESFRLDPQDFTDVFKNTWDENDGDNSVIAVMRYKHSGGFNPFGGGSKDYCGSWSDAGPIIQANKIPLNPFRGEWVAGERRNVKDKNPLRAAMIVFLMMKGGE